MNKKILTVILIIVLFIPTFVAVGYYSSTQTGPNSKNDVKELTIKDPDGTEWHFASGDTDGDSAAMIELFFGMGSHAEEATSLPEALKSTDFFLVTVTSFGTDQDYQYYFTDKPSEAYYVDSVTGAAYKIAEDDAAAFLRMTKYSASVLPDHELPTLIVDGNGILLYCLSR